MTRDTTTNSDASATPDDAADAGDHTTADNAPAPSDAPMIQPPIARLAPVRRRWWVWLIPLAAAGVFAWMGYHHWIQQGQVITITFASGHGLAPGNPLRCRGIEVGHVQQVTLDDDLRTIRVTARLAADSDQHLAASDRIARVGTRFWIVRPRFSITEIGGLDTIVGPLYINVLPTTDPVAAQQSFKGLEAEPVLATEPPGGVELILSGDRRAGIRAGAPVLFRQMRIGTVVSVGLASDSRSVDSRIYIRPAYTGLVRENSRFWAASGVSVEMGLSQWFALNVDSLQTLLDGGVTVATPSPAGSPVKSEQRFELFMKPEKEWLQWSAAMPVGQAGLVQGANGVKADADDGAILPGGLPASAAPPVIRGTVTRQTTSFGLFTSTTHQAVWLIPTAAGLIAPADVVDPNAGSAPPVLKFRGREIPITAQAAMTATRQNGLAFFPQTLQDPVAPANAWATAPAPVNCFVVGDPALPPAPLSAARLTAQSRDSDPANTGANPTQFWAVDKSIKFEDHQHGSAILSEKSQIIGVLLVHRGQGKIVPIPKNWPPAPPADPADPTAP